MRHVRGLPVETVALLLCLTGAEAGEAESRASLQRALAACMEGRGYTVR